MKRYNGCLANLHQFTNVQNRKVFVLTDSGVPAEYAQTVAAQCPDSTICTIPQGEGSKCLKIYGQVLQAMLEFGMDRKDLLVSGVRRRCGRFGRLLRRQLYARH